MQSLTNITTIIHSQVSSVVDAIPGVYQARDDLEHDITTMAMKTVTSAAIALIVLTIISALVNDRIPKLKLPLFVLITATLVGSTAVLIGGTVYLNVKADSGGPVHWHADIEYWACGNELELRNPTGRLSNKIGTAVLHEHDDKRIHLEGVVVEEEVDASLGKFMHVIGGAITEDDLVIPLDADISLTYEDDVDGDGPSSPNPELVAPFIKQDGANGRIAQFTSGQQCGDETAEVQTFVYRFNEGDDSYTQYKLDNPEELATFNVDKVNQFSIYDDSNVPPGDCIIFEFDVPKSKTDKLCEQYGVRDINECERYGVEASKRAICTNTQTNYDPTVDYRITPEPETDEEDVLGITDDAEKTEIQQLGEQLGEFLVPSVVGDGDVLGAKTDESDDTTLEEANIFNIGGAAGGAAARQATQNEGGAN